ncbi:helix-turn-helix domain-containing protein [Listeria monocytogenes]|uniref:helix-turn-helix domain-containing protein n=1 Tax=Listeria monocytogenes TaxID=1639 RepID=UPI001D1144BF|nr:helix-turn-helix domain-containing protein [Listeria monocytogenes]
MEIKEKDILTAEEAAEMLGMKKRTIQSWARNAGLPGKKINGKTWILVRENSKRG